MKANYSETPQVLQNQNNGSTLYNYDIQKEIIEERDSFTCSQVIIWGEVTKKKAIKAIISDEYPIDLENKTVNDYHAFAEGILEDQKYRDNYLFFLARRRQIKEMIAKEELIPVTE